MLACQHDMSVIRVHYYHQALPTRPSYNGFAWTAMTFPFIALGTSQKSNTPPLTVPVTL